MLVAASADDVMLTRAFTGLQTNMLRPSIVAAGFDPKALPERGMIDVAKDINLEAQGERPRRWRDIWSAAIALRASPKSSASRRWSQRPSANTSPRPSRAAIARRVDGASARCKARRNTRCAR